MRVTNIKEMKILKYFVLFTHCPTCFSSQRMRQRNDSSFVYDNSSNFIHTWGNFDP